MLFYLILEILLKINNIYFLYYQDLNININILIFYFLLQNVSHLNLDIVEVKESYFI